jgi:hypothetical protein
MNDYSFLAIPFGITEGNPLLFEFPIFNIQYPITNFQSDTILFIPLKSGIFVFSWPSQACLNEDRWKQKVMSEANE